MNSDWHIGQDLESLRDLMAQLKADLEGQANSRRSIKENRRKERAKELRPPDPAEWKRRRDELIATGKTDLVIGYWRVSLEKQTEGEGPETQQRHIVAWATANTARGVDLWVWDVDSGKEESRVGIDFIRETMERGCVRAVVPFRYDRLARNQFLSELLHREAREHGVMIRSATEDLPEGPVGVLMRQVIQAIAQYEAAVIVMRMSEGKRTRQLREGTYNGGEVPYGYVAAGKGHLLVCEPEARIVRLIYRLYEMGYSQSAIAECLNRWGIPTRLRGKMGWRQGQVRRILSHESAYRSERLFSRKCVAPDKIAHSAILPPRTAGVPDLLGNVRGLPSGTQVPDDIWGDAVPQPARRGTVHSLSSAQAVSLKTLFHLRDSGMTLAAVAVELNRLGYRALSGRAWTPSNVQQYSSRRALYQDAIAAADLETPKAPAGRIESAAVERIKQLRTAGLSYWQIKRILDSESQETASGRPWSISSIQRVTKGRERRATKCAESR